MLPWHCTSSYLLWTLQISLLFVLCQSLTDSWMLRVFRRSLGLATANIVIVRAFCLKKREWTQAASGWEGLWATTSRSLLSCNSCSLLLPSSRCLSVKQSPFSILSLAGSSWFPDQEHWGTLIDDRELDLFFHPSLQSCLFLSIFCTDLENFWLDVVQFISLGQVLKVLQPLS